KKAIGTPYFYPRRSVKDPTNPTRLKFVDKKIGFDFEALLQEPLNTNKNNEK
ncbi:MAG: hypothetical protein RLZZ497_836, partial [Pseudomonadota bacterium]